AAVARIEAMGLPALRALDDRAVLALSGELAETTALTRAEMVELGAHLLAQVAPERFGSPNTDFVRGQAKRLQSAADRLLAPDPAGKRWRQMTADQRLDIIDAE